MNDPAQQTPLQIVRIPVDKPAPAVEFLRTHGHGVMDLIAHFWERLAQTPPLLRQDLHLVAAVRSDRPPESPSAEKDDRAANTAKNGGSRNATPPAGPARSTSAPSTSSSASPPSSATPSTSAGSRATQHAATGSSTTPPALPASSSATTPAPASAKPAGNNGGNDHKADIYTYDNTLIYIEGVMLYVPKAYRADVLAPTAAAAETLARYILSAGTLNAQSPDAKPAPPRCAIDFLTGGAEGIDAMVPLLLPAAGGKKSPAKTLVNIMMHLPPEIPAGPDAAVRPAGVGDLPALNRWRRLYREERGILFDADMDAWVESQKVFVAEHEGQIAAAAKFDLELATLIEIGGVYTFPEFRNHGFAQRIMNDLAARIRSADKTPTLQVDETNLAAADLYRKMGWKSLGRLGRVWLTDG